MKGSPCPARLARPTEQFKSARTTGLAAALVFLISSVANAQVQRGPGPQSKMILIVPAFVSADKALGCSAANEVRNHLDDETDPTKLWVITQEHIDESLKASGFPPCTPVSPTDNKQLAQQLRGDEYVDGSATKTATGFRLDAKLVLAANASAVQPLPPAEATKIGDAARLVARSVLAAVKGLPGAIDCFNNTRANKYPEALASARTAIAAYPNSMIARLCIADAMVLMKAPPDSVVTITKEILASDPTNHRALELQAQAYFDLKNYDGAVKAWGALIAANPSNTALVEDVVTKIVRSGHADAALPIVAQASKDNPDDPKLVALYYRLLYFSGHYKDAIPVGIKAFALDTSFGDTVYFQHQTTAYLADSQPQKAAETAAQGLAKFPSNSTLLGLDAQSLLKAGQTQQAVPILQKLVAANPKSTATWEQLYTAYVTMQKPDSALWALHGAVASDSAERSKAGGYALSQANNYFKKGNASKSMDTLAIAIKFAAYADSLAPRPETKFIMGASQYIIGSMYEQEGAKAKNCEQVKSALTYWNAAAPNIHAGGSVSPPFAADALQTITKYTPAIESQIKVICK